MKKIAIVLITLFLLYVIVLSITIYLHEYLIPIPSIVVEKQQITDWLDPKNVTDPDFVVNEVLRHVEDNTPGFISSVEDVRAYVICDSECRVEELIVEILIRPAHDYNFGYSFRKPGYYNRARFFIDYDLGAVEVNIYPETKIIISSPDWRDLSVTLSDALLISQEYIEAIYDLESSYVFTARKFDSWSVYPNTFPPTLNENLSSFRIDYSTGEIITKP